MQASPCKSLAFTLTRQQRAPAVAAGARAGRDMRGSLISSCTRPIRWAVGVWRQRLSGKTGAMTRLKVALITPANDAYQAAIAVTIPM